jgi:hypothetical protein
MLKKLILALNAMMITVLFVLILMQEAAQPAMQDIMYLLELAHNVKHHVLHAVDQELVPALDVLQENFWKAMPALVHVYLLLVVQHAQILLHVSLALRERKL